MSKKPDTASALAGILKARRGDEAAIEPAVAEPVTVAPPPPPPPSPALPPTPAPSVAAPPVAVAKGRGGKSSDKENFSQHSIYLRKGTQIKATRALQDSGSHKDFSDLVQELVDQWLKAST